MSIAEHRIQRREKERGMELRVKWLAIHAALAVYSNFNTQTGQPDEAGCKQLEEAHAEVCALVGDKDFDKALKLAKEEYNKSHTGRITKDMLHFVTEPASFNVQKMIADKWNTYMLGYRDYWESQIAQLVRKHTIGNRGRYLVRCIEENLLPKAHELGLADAAKALQEYRKYNLSQLGTEK